ncbi:hypothetical protein NUITMVS3_25630 [Shewanella xiamenensis]|nr:hypothetical protein NUITMVS2_42190 [Shewanella xiamenensis]GLD78131.1 hypothetical protein NUITMVS3_25630 [Shewanella xiamenensis]
MKMEQNFYTNFNLSLSKLKASDMDEMLTQWAASICKEVKQSKPVLLLQRLNTIPSSPQLVKSRDIPPLG